MAAKKKSSPRRTKAATTSRSKPRAAAKTRRAPRSAAAAKPRAAKRTRAARRVDADTLRDDVRRLSVEAFRGGRISTDRITSFVNDVFDGAMQNVDRSIPASRSNVLRQVFDGLGEGVRAVAAAGSETAQEAGERIRRTINAADADKRVRKADRDFLSAVRSFADRASIEVQQELDSLVDRAERTGPKVTTAMRHAGEAARGNWGELSEESLRAGGRMTRNAVGALAATLSGFFQGIDDAANAGSDARGSRRPRKR